MLRIILPLKIKPRLYLPFRARSLSSGQACTKYLTATHTDEEVSSHVNTILDRESSYLLSPYNRPRMIVVRGSGCTLWDSKGREFLDMTAGIAVNALGHADESVARVLEGQARKLVHCSNLFNNEHAGQLAETIVQATQQHGGLGLPPQSEEQSNGLKLFIANSGSEANEGALKFARKVGKTLDPTGTKHGIVCFSNAFHGRTMGSLSVTFQPKYQEPFRPLIPGVTCGHLNDISGLQDLVTDTTCGVIVEPIQGEGGVLEASEEFLRALRRRCDEVKAVLIYDEIQCGLGRTGTFWAHGNFPTDCHPDIVTMAKPLANGIPIGGVLMRDLVAKTIVVGDHGTTFGGGPLQTAVARHVVSRISSPGLLESVRRNGEHLKRRLDRLYNLFPSIVASESRGRGLMLGLPFKGEQYPPEAVKLCHERGVLLLTCGNNTLRFVPSLIIKPNEIDFACDVLESSLFVLNKNIHEAS